jgi:hypothetical protein
LTLEVFQHGVLHGCQLLEGLFWLYSVSSYHSSGGFQSLELFPLGQQRRVII